MPEFQTIRTTLDVGFSEERPIPEVFLSACGKYRRSIGGGAAFPFEDRQFDSVIISSTVLSPETVREAHRVLKGAGWLMFRVPERKGSRAGYTMDEIYNLVRSGFDILRIERPKWWHFGRRGHHISIFARKKNWCQIKNRFRPLV